jgi:polyamine oxidase
MQAVEWWQWDWESAYEPEYSSQIFGVVGANATFNQFSGDSVLVHDSRGYSFWLKEEAKSLNPTDSNLWLSTVVTNITYTDQQVTVHTKDGRCIEAAYAICTFSLGVLQNDAVNFEPPLPQWKREGIETFTMGTYTKIFLQFRQDDIFWDRNNASQFLLYADPHRRGYYPAWEPLDIPGFLPGSGIIFGTITHEEAYRVESQGYEETKKRSVRSLGQDVPAKHL